MGLIVRSCVGCGQTDDHPRHVIALRDGTTMDWHMDCHANNGCQSCAHQTRNKGETVGDEFRVILETQDQEG